LAVLRMARPIKRSGSDNWYYRNRIPQDVLEVLAKLPRHQWPKGWGKGDIWISLKTPDRDLAKVRHAVISASVERKFRAYRGGPQALTTKQISALSGTAYNAFAKGLEDNPGLTVEGWLSVASQNHLAQQGLLSLGARLGIFPNKGERITADLEHRFGGLADATLHHANILTDADSRQSLINALSRDLSEASKKLARNADGNYSPDAYANRFPPPSEVQPSPLCEQQPVHTLTGLAEAWYADALSRGVRLRDANRWKSVALRFHTWLESQPAPLSHDLSRITPANVQLWGDARIAEGISPKTVNDTDFAALRAIFNFGKLRGYIATNPAEEARIIGRRQRVTRDRHFSREEATTILKASSAVQGSKREHPKTTAAKRWVPWLCAYTGARIAEMIQLRKEDVRQEPNGSYVIRLTPDAGDIKTNEFRDVPIHEHLITTGFLAFLEQAHSGHLFCTEGKDGSIAGSVDGVSCRIRDLVRSVVPDPAVQPNHAWRYSFKTYGHEAGIDSNTLDAICGHSPRTQGQAYTGVTLVKKFEAMALFPRYF